MKKKKGADSRSELLQKSYVKLERRNSRFKMQKTANPFEIAEVAPKRRNSQEARQDLSDRIADSSGKGPVLMSERAPKNQSLKLER